MADLPKVTIIVLNYNGIEHLDDCFSSLTKINYPAERLELMLVDNGSSDSSIEYIKSRYPQTLIVRNRENLGFAGGNNAGAREATGQYVLFLNNDMRADSRLVHSLFKGMQCAPDVICTGARILTWDGSQIDFGGGAAHFAGYAYQVDAGKPFNPESRSEIQPVLYACGGAMLIDRGVFLEVGGFDEDYFALYEDLDLGWRLNLLGYKVLFVPKALVYHRHHGTIDKFANHRQQVLLKRNALYSVIKNYDDKNLGRILPGVLLGTIDGIVDKAVMEKQLDLEEYHFSDASRSTKPKAALNKQSISTLVAMHDVVEHLPSLMNKRRFIQKKRRRSDEQVAPLFRSPFLYWPDVGAQTQYRIADAFGLQDIFQTIARRVLVISSDILPYPGLPTVGSGLRAWGIGEGLKSQGHEVLYSMPRAALEGREALVPKQVCELAWRNHTLLDVIRLVEPDLVVVCNWPVMALVPTDQLGTIPVILDQHGPHNLEREFQKAGDPKENAYYKTLAMKKADFFSCAGKKQFEYFRPWLERAGWSEREILERACAIPVSLSPDLPERNLRDDLTFVYGGVFLPWQDPSVGLYTLVEKLAERNQGILRLYGGKHPVYNVDTGNFEPLLKQLSTSAHVINMGMLSHDELIVEYTRAHVAIDLMRRNQERELAFTTRTVEYLWCGLPVIYNNYSELSDYIREHDAGWVVDPEDRQAIRVVIDEIIDHPESIASKSENARRLAREHLSWDRTIEPIDHYVRHPSIRRRSAPSSPASAARHEAIRAWSAAKMHYRQGGLQALSRAGLAYLRRRVE